MNDAPRLELYDAAKSLIGQSLCKNPMLGCTESISKVINKAFGEHLAYTGTVEIYDYFLRSPHWEEVTSPLPGDAILCVSGTATNPRVEHGHIGILGMNKSNDGSVYIMSNNSNTGRFDTHLTLNIWYGYFGAFAGFKVRFFRRCA
jgi:hypothetical protein